MSQGIIVPQLNSNVDGIAITKRVYFRPSTATDTVRVGDIVCLNTDATTDYKERSTQPSANGAAYAEGSQNYTGRLFIAEKPASGNMFAVAVVAELGPLAGADGDLISVYPLQDGAVVPVITDLSTTQGATVLACQAGQYEATNPVYGGSTDSFRIIGLAEETVDRSSADGLVWMRMSTSGIWGVTGGNGGVSANVVTLGPAATSGDMYGGFLSLKTTATGGSLTGLRIRAELDGAGSSVIALRAEGVIADGSSAQDGDCATITSHLIFKSGATAGAYSFYGLEAKVENSDATPADISAAVRCAALKLVTQISSTNAPLKHYIIYVRNDGSDTVDAFIKFESATTAGISAATGDTAHDASDKAIPVEIGGTTYYIIAQDSKG